MDFLADESCDAALLQALRADGHDVSAVADVARGAPDPVVLQMALDEQRILLTEDKDFGQLVYASGAKTLGVILFRYPPAARSATVQTLLELTRNHAHQILRNFIVVEPGRIRISPAAASGP